MQKPRKLIRANMQSVIAEKELFIETDITELRKLYLLKLKEETQEIVNSDFKDASEYADAIEVLMGLAACHGLTEREIMRVRDEKAINKGKFTTLVLTSLNPDNPSNALYFEKTEKEKIVEKINSVYKKLSDEVGNDYEYRGIHELHSKILEAI